ncbi:MAG: hypothetical protein JW839_14830 [Candidatus Lokiarchaeota archaeon]|nr:hypothetical protein [Candidatus Lokiarchaeota archaeon]
MTTFDMVVGIGLALLATTLFSISPILQKGALGGMKDLTEHGVRASIMAMFKDRKWVLGLVLGLVGGIPYAIAVSMIGITVVEPLNNAGFIILVAAAVRYLHERLRPIEIAAIILLMAMPVFLGMADVSRPRNDITQGSVQLVLVLVTGVLLAITGTLAFMARKHPIYWVGVTSILISLGSIYLQACMSFVAFAGYDFPAGLLVIVASLFTDWRLVAGLACGLLSFVFSVFFTYTSQIALQKNPASKVGPLTQTIDNFFTVAVGILVLGQAVGNWAWYSAGFGVGIFGTVMLGKYEGEVKGAIKKGTGGTVD